MKTPKRYGLYWFLWSLTILIIIGIPGNYIPKTPHFIDLFSPDKIIHLFLFFPFGYFAFKYLLRKKFLQNNFKKIISLSLVFGIIYASSSELLQFFIIVGRNGNLYDAIADIVGSILGILFAFWHHKHYSKERKITNN